jgi:hypothetical protein
VAEDRALKYRARATTRDVPTAPPLCALLDAHLAGFGVGPDGRLFVTRRGPGGRLIPGKPRPVPNNTHTAVWRKARQAALTPAQERSALARRPYDLRHAAVSTWLNAGVPAPQVAEWAGHSVHVLLKVYAKCIDGQDEAARQRIERALTSEIDRFPERPNGTDNNGPQPAFPLVGGRLPFTWRVKDSNLRSFRDGFTEAGQSAPHTAADLPLH